MAGAGAPRRDAPGFTARVVQDLVDEAGDIATFSARATLHALGAWHYFAEILRQAALLALGSGLVIVAMVMVIGGECGLFGIYLLRSVGAESFLGAQTPICGLREMWPYMFGYLFAAKVGCGLVAEIGSMRISEEIDALEAVGVKPMHYIVATRLLAVWLVVPAIYAIAIVFGAIGSYLVIIVQFGEISQGQWESLLIGTWRAEDTVYSMLKTMALATTIALVGIYYGYRARGGPVGVGAATARSMIVNLVLIHLIGAAFSVVLWGSEMGWGLGG